MSELKGVHDASQEGLEVRKAITDWFEGIEVGEERPLGAIDITPLVHPGPHEPPFMLQHEAIAANLLKVAEQGAGTVNTVVAFNGADRPVLILEGESLVGARQNRVVTEDILLVPGGKVDVPVACVEQGRWRFNSRQFESAPTPVEPTVRRRNVHEAAACGRVDQGRVWRDVNEKLARAKAHSETADYHSFVRCRGSEAFRLGQDLMAPVPGQVGILARHRDVLVGLDVLGHPDNWAAYSARSMMSYALSAVSEDWEAFRREAGALAGGRSPQDWLREVVGATMKVRPGRGLGLQLRIHAPSVRGFGLWVGRRPAHVAVFAGE